MQAESDPADQRTRTPSAEQVVGQGAAIDSRVRGHLTQNGGERTDAELRVSRNGDVVLAVSLGREAQMATRLARDGIAEFAQRLRQVATRKIPG